METYRKETSILSLLFLIYYPLFHQWIIYPLPSREVFVYKGGVRKREQIWFLFRRLSPCSKTCLAIFVGLGLASVAETMNVGWAIWLLHLQIEGTCTLSQMFCFPCGEEKILNRIITQVYLLSQMELSAVDQVQRLRKNPFPKSWFFQHEGVHSEYCTVDDRSSCCHFADVAYRSFAVKHSTLLLLSGSLGISTGYVLTWPFFLLKHTELQQVCMFLFLKCSSSCYYYVKMTLGIRNSRDSVYIGLQDYLMYQACYLCFSVNQVHVRTTFAIFQGIWKYYFLLSHHSWFMMTL